MRLRTRLANWLLRRLLDFDATGEPTPPGGALALRFQDADRADVAIVVEGDAVVLYHGALRAPTVMRASLSPRAALRMAWFILWTWWANELVFGLKLRLWQWAIAARQ